MLRDIKEIYFIGSHLAQYWFSFSTKYMGVYFKICSSSELKFYDFECLKETNYAWMLYNGFFLNNKRRICNLCR